MVVEFEKYWQYWRRIICFLGIVWKQEEWSLQLLLVTKTLGEILSIYLILTVS
jgi:hypothetical protein